MGDRPDRESAAESTKLSAEEIRALYFANGGCIPDEYHQQVRDLQIPDLCAAIAAWETLDPVLANLDFGRYRWQALLLQEGVVLEDWDAEYVASKGDFFSTMGRCHESDGAVASAAGKLGRMDRDFDDAVQPLFEMLTEGLYSDEYVQSYFRLYPKEAGKGSLQDPAAGAISARRLTHYRNFEFCYETHDLIGYLLRKTCTQFEPERELARWIGDAVYYFHKALNIDQVIAMRWDLHQRALILEDILAQSPDDPWSLAWSAQVASRLKMKSAIVPATRLLEVLPHLERETVSSLLLLLLAFSGMYCEEITEMSAVEDCCDWGLNANFGPSILRGTCSAGDSTSFLGHYVRTCCNASVIGRRFLRHLAAACGEYHSIQVLDPWEPPFSLPSTLWVLGCLEYDNEFKYYSEKLWFCSCWEAALAAAKAEKHEANTILSVSKLILARLFDDSKDVAAHINVMPAYVTTDRGRTATLLFLKRLEACYQAGIEFGAEVRVAVHDACQRLELSEADLAVSATDSLKEALSRRAGTRFAFLAKHELEQHLLGEYECLHSEVRGRLETAVQLYLIARDGDHEGLRDYRPAIVSLSGAMERAYSLATGEKVVSLGYIVHVFKQPDKNRQTYSLLLKAMNGSVSLLKHLATCLEPLLMIRNAAAHGGSDVAAQDAYDFMDNLLVKGTLARYLMLMRHASRVRLTPEQER